MHWNKDVINVCFNVHVYSILGLRDSSSFLWQTSLRSHQLVFCHVFVQKKNDLIIGLLSWIYAENNDLIIGLLSFISAENNYLIEVNDLIKKTNWCGYLYTFSLHGKLIFEDEIGKDFRMMEVILMIMYLCYLYICRIIYLSEL